MPQANLALPGARRVHPIYCSRDSANFPPQLSAPESSSGQPVAMSLVVFAAECRSEWGLSCLLKRLNLSRQKTRSSHPKGNPAAQTAFKKGAARKLVHDCGGAS